MEDIPGRPLEKNGWSVPGNNNLYQSVETKSRVADVATGPRSVTFARPATHHPALAERIHTRVVGTRGLHGKKLDGWDRGASVGKSAGLDCCADASDAPTERPKASRGCDSNWPG
ncbi:hypothetical protein FOMPIDRAFT_94613 [Fomitopsis schrenkii]|uniref:Uncharacterized protein n=1 Tax=Fomitopsis schrenkii TaxID=2126942 RepID=S8DMG0_FOMSC|nr:hypothetical protein FOMPIDRAFT_94613 [Fomitopsis schrenkii]